MRRVREVLLSVLLTAVTVILFAGVAEGILRLKNSSMTNYDIEMWRYANELKIRDPDPAIDFEHVRSKVARLQNVDIRLNEWGLRGEPVKSTPPVGRRILFLGGSITLGWGVPEDETVEAVLESRLRARGQDVQVLNGGVGNYNTERYVSRFLKKLTGLDPSDIVVQYFLRDAEALPSGGGNFVLRHSQLAMTLWIASNRLFEKNGEARLIEHYRDVYGPAAPGFAKMRDELKVLADYCKARGIRLFFAMTPDVHNLVDYRFGFVHEIMLKIAKDNGYRTVDLLPALLGRRPEDLWAMPGDPHPNSLGHKLMADALYPVLAEAPAATETK